jgi:mitotic spindle assembly checkpoint protein MAD1
MDELYKRFNEVVKENTRLKHQTIDLQSTLEMKEQELNLLKCTSGADAYLETIRHLEAENRRLRSMHEKENQLENSGGSVEAEECGGSKEELKKLMKNIRNYVTGLVGYRMDFNGDEIVCHSLYAFSKEDAFVFKDQDGEIQLMVNDFACAYEKEIQTYLTRGKSIPAFLAAVTLDLFSKSTF